MIEETTVVPKIPAFNANAVTYPETPQTHAIQLVKKKEIPSKMTVIRLSVMVIERKFEFEVLVMMVRRSIPG